MIRIEYNKKKNYSKLRYIFLVSLSPRLKWVFQTKNCSLSFVVVVKFPIFIVIAEPLGRFQPNLAQRIFWGKGLFKLKASYAFKGNVESLVWCLTIFFSRTTGQILTTVGTTLPWGNGFKFVKWRIISISERKIIRESKIRAGNLIIFSRSLWQILVKHGTKQPWVKVFHMYSNER